MYWSQWWLLDHHWEHKTFVSYQIKPLASISLKQFIYWQTSSHLIHIPQKGSRMIESHDNLNIKLYSTCSFSFVFFLRKSINVLLLVWLSVRVKTNVLDHRSTQYMMFYNFIFDKWLIYWQHSFSFEWIVIHLSCI